MVNLISTAMESPRISSSSSHTKICMSKSLDAQRRISKDSGTGSEIPRKYSGVGLDVHRKPCGITSDNVQRPYGLLRAESNSSAENSDDVFGEHSCMKDVFGERNCMRGVFEEQYKELFEECAAASKEEGRPPLHKLDTIDSASGLELPDQSENKDVGSWSV